MLSLSLPHRLLNDGFYVLFYLFFTLALCLDIMFLLLFE